MICDFHLRSSGKTAMDNALQAAGLIDQEDETPVSPDVLIDRIGTISRVAGYNGNQPIVETAEGYHLNLRLLFEPTAEQIEALYPVTILPPGEPFRTWA